MPFAIVSALVRRSSSVMPGVANGGYRTMEVPGWPAGPTVIRAYRVSDSLRTSKRGCRGRSQEASRVVVREEARGMVMSMPSFRGALPTALSIPMRRVT